MKIKKTREKLIGCIAHCLVCTWGEELYTEAFTKAKMHILKTGHTVAIEKVLYTSLSKINGK